MFHREFCLSDDLASSGVDGEVFLTAVILTILYIPHITSLFRLFAFAYPNATVRWGRHRESFKTVPISVICP